MIDLAHDGLPQPAKHYRATYCEDCNHIRAEHLDDGCCFPKLDAECDCTRFTRVNTVTLTLGRDMTNQQATAEPSERDNG